MASYKLNPAQSRYLPALPSPHRSGQPEEPRAVGDEVESNEGEGAGDEREEDYENCVGEERHR